MHKFNTHIQEMLAKQPIALQKSNFIVKLRIAVHTNLVIFTIFIIIFNSSRQLTRNTIIHLFLKTNSISNNTNKFKKRHRADFFEVLSYQEIFERTKLNFKFKLLKFQFFSNSYVKQNKFQSHLLRIR